MSDDLVLFVRLCPQQMKVQGERSASSPFECQREARPIQASLSRTEIARMADYHYSRMLAVDDAHVREAPDIEREWRELEGIETAAGADPRRMIRHGAVGAWIAGPDVKFRGIDGMSGVSSGSRIYLRGDSKVSAFLRGLAAETEDSSRKLLIFVTVFLALNSLKEDQAIAAAGAQLKRIEGDLGEDVVKGGDEFVEALKASPTSLFDTSVWIDRDAEF